MFFLYFHSIVSCGFDLNSFVNSACICILCFVIVELLLCSRQSDATSRI